MASDDNTSVDEEPLLEGQRIFNGPELLRDALDRMEGLLDAE